MGRQILQMKYHPAKKEVTFSRSISGKKIEITGSSGSVLSKYINKKGQFVLQDHGNQFFEDILEAFDGEDVISLDVTTTRKDFEDFKQMIEYFNQTSKIKITANLLAELPDMNAAYEAVKDHGLESIAILKTNRDKFHEVDTDNPNVQACIENFSKEINEAAIGILKKIDTLEQNSVNVCFSGPYSSGKSLLIDSLIGYAILPTDIRPETAAMFRISSPKKDENVRINFHIDDSEDSFSEIVWNEQDQAFLFAAGPSESKTRKAIQEVMNECKNKRQYEQVHEILNALNSNKNVERVINVFFPISIDNDKVQFTIYDTPGTDSGVLAHKNILKDALSEQTHSILVFVTYPNGLSGGGNKALLEYLSEIDKREDRSTIDLGRSLFVINYADSLTDDDAFEAIRTGKISNKKDVEDEDKKAEEESKVITIKLSDKKVFFTTAKYAYPAAAMKNGAETKGDLRLLNSGSAKDVLDDELGKYYKQDRCATSEFATKLLIDKCDSEFAMAKEKGDQAGMLWVASGLYALQSEIMEYGEKYASAVKAFSIIDGIDKALGRLNRNAQSIERQNGNDIQEVDREISAIKGKISNGISSAKKGRELGRDNRLPDEAIKTLWLDSDSITKKILNPAEEKVDDIILGRLQRVTKSLSENVGVEYSPKETKWDESKEAEIDKAIRGVLADYTENFRGKRKELLEKLRDNFITDVKELIMKNGELSDEAKEFILDIETPEIDEFEGSGEFGELYRKDKKTKKVLWMNKEYLDREGFIEDMKKKLITIAGKLADSYKENYRNSLNKMLGRVESEFISNMDKYSVLLKARQEDKDALEQLRDKILDAVKQLQMCQNKLDSIIWEVKK